MSEEVIHDIADDIEIKPLKFGSNKSLETVETPQEQISIGKDSDEKLQEAEQTSNKKIMEDFQATETLSQETMKDNKSITSANTVDESTQTEPLTIQAPAYIDGLQNVNIPSPTPSDYSDDQIDNLLKEVEEIKKNSPIKPIVQDTPTKPKEQDIPSKPTTPKTPTSVNQSTSVNLSPVPTRSNTPTEDLSKLRINKTTSRPMANIPQSVSQALFSKTLKVTKVGDKAQAPKFIGLKPPITPAQNAKIEELQKKDYELTAKIKKLNREIDYLKNLIDSASITSNLEELRKLKYAIQRLEEYLDVKNKEKYEVGMNLTRALRRRVDSGEIAEFWASN